MNRALRPLTGSLSIFSTSPTCVSSSKIIRLEDHPPRVLFEKDGASLEKVESLESLRSALEVAHDLGVAIVLDDITSGYGTLRCCPELAPRWIKVDSALTRGIGRDRRRRAVLKMLARVARDFSVALIAEGVESAEDLEVCFHERVFAAQGQFLARPDERPAPASSDLRVALRAESGRGGGAGGGRIRPARVADPRIGRDRRGPAGRNRAGATGGAGRGAAGDLSADPETG